MAFTFWHVAPRYTSGSPAQVSESTAHIVARQERDGYNRARSGLYGQEDVDRALALGIRAIVYSTREVGGTIRLYDIMTDEEYRIPTKHWEGQHWYERKDTEQFKVQGDGGTTLYERSGKRYQAVK